MDPLQIFDKLAESGRLPIEAIHAARDNRDAMVRLFLERVQICLNGAILTDDEADGLFMAFHLLGEWREKAAYRPLARLLRQPYDTMEHILGDATTATAHRVMAAVFDGDVEPLLEIIRDPAADEFVRKSMFDALTMLTMSGELPRADTVQFLKACFSELEPQQNCYAWQGWIDAIVWMRLTEMTPLVEQAFARGTIDASWMSLKDFEMELQHALEHPDAEPLYADGKLSLFGDVVEELKDWACFQPQKQRAPGTDWQPSGLQEPEHNPLRHVGRNDPCPCGSGKKAARDDEAGSVLKLS